MDKIFTSPSSLLQVTQTPEICLLAISLHSDALKYINVQTEDMCKFSISIHPTSYKYIDETLLDLFESTEISPEIFLTVSDETIDTCWEKIYENVDNFMYIKNPTDEMCEYAFSKDTILLEFIPLEERTMEMCQIAFEENIYSIDYFPLEFITDEMATIAYNHDHNFFHYLKEPTYDQIVRFVSMDGDNLSFIDPKYITQELVDIAIKNNCYLTSIPDEFLTQDIVNDRVFNNKYLFKKIPKKFITQEIKEICAFQYPHDICLSEISYQTLKTVIASKPNQIRRCEQTKELCWIALRASKNSIIYINNPTNEMLEYAIDSCFRCSNIFNEEQNLYRMETYVECINYIDKPSFKIFEKAVRIDPSRINPKVFTRLAYEYLDHPDINDLLHMTIEKHPYYINYVIYQTEELCNLAIDTDPSSLKYIRVQTSELCIRAFEKDSSSYKFIRDSKLQSELLSH